jgi:hypothetical protein
VIAALTAVAARVPLAPDFVPRICGLIKDLPEALDQAVAAAADFADQTASGAAPLHRAPPPQPEPEPPARRSSASEFLR